MATQSVDAADTGQSASERFFKYFQHEITALQEQMARLGDTALVGGERKDAMDHCLAGITRLSSEVKDASKTLPSYDLRTYTEAIKALQDKLAESQAQHAPKQRFSFKTRKNESAISLQDAAELAAQKRKSLLTFSSGSNTSSNVTTPLHIETPPNERLTQHHLDSNISTERSIGPSSQATDEASVGTDQPGLTATNTTTSVSSLSNIHIILPASASRHQTPCTLSALRTCCVDLSVPTKESLPFASLTVTDVQSSLMLCSSVAGPAHITGVKNSILLISCRQLRMHECENVDIYLYCTSRPIIEDCKGLRFAEMPSFYTDLLHSAHATPNQAVGTNMWEHVDDFKWLRSEQSPNWKILPKGEQISEKLLKDITVAKPGISLDEILDIASIQRLLTN